jgi:hypothetical protein
MTFTPNSMEARDVAYHLHSYSNPQALAQTGAVVMERGDGASHRARGTSRADFFDLRRFDGGDRLVRTLPCGWATTGAKSGGSGH